MWKWLAAAMILVVAGVAWAAPGTNGTVEEKYDSGAIKARYSVAADGVRQGSFQTFYADGKAKETGEYARGELQGEFYSFHPNGQRALSCSYQKGALEGAWTSFDDKGQKTASGEYRAGKKSGVFRDFEGGRVVLEQLFVGGELILPRSEAMIGAKLAEIRKMKVATVAPAEAIPAHRGVKQSEEDRAAGVRMLMEYRYLCDVPVEVSLDATYNAHDEAAAALLVAIDKLDHQPANPGWPDEDYQFAKKGCGSSNLSMGSSNPADAVRGFMDDSDASNIDRLGHRRWCLNPRMAKTGFGSAGKFVVMWSFDQTRKEVPDYEYVACPAAGLFPNSHFTAGEAWSISLNPNKYRQPDEKKIKVSVKPAQITLAPAAIRTGADLKLNYFHVDTQGFGIPNAIIFRFDRCTVQAGAAYMVEVSGLQTTGGAAATLKYLVEFYAPAK